MPKHLRDKKNSSPPFPLRLNLASFVVFIFVVVLCSLHCVDARPSPDREDFWDFKKKKTRDDFDFDDEETMETIVNIIVGVVVFFFVAIIAFIACLCCPICLLAKMRGRRRGVVYRSAVEANGTTVTTEERRGGTTITISAPPSRAANANQVQSIPVASTATSPSVIAISNNAHKQNKPYPVQESVTVVPLVVPQQQPPMMSHPGYLPQQQQVPYHQYQQPGYQQPPYDPSQQQYPGPADPPPPYPGLTRDIDNANLPFNPYYTDGPQASAPPTKQ